MKISCIIPAYNEEKSIANTLRAVLQVHELFEVIVVNDCSTDATGEIVEKFPNVKLINNEKNKGKSRSIVSGIEASAGDHLLLLDADLLGINPETIKKLLLPVQSGRADVVISFRENTPKWLLKLVGIEILSGDRVFPRSLVVEQIEEMKSLPSLGLEVFLNRIIIQKKLRIQSVLMENVKNDFKWNKRGFLSGMKEEIQMWTRNILKVISLWGFVYQNFRMRQLLVEEEK